MAKSKDSAPATYYHYTGDGAAWVGGVPARDLTPDEWDALTDDQRLICTATGLYRTGAGPALPAPIDTAPTTPTEA